MPQLLRNLVGCCLLWALAGPTSAGLWDQPLPEGGQVIFRPTPGDAGSPGLELIGAQVQLGRLETAPGDDELAGQKTYRVTVRDQAQQRWNLQLAGDIDPALTPGHVYLLRFAARCAESTTGDGSATLKIERNGPDWSNVLARAFTFGPQWTPFDLPFQVQPGQGLPAGEAHLTFHLGETVQTIELADVQLIDFADRVALEDLPRTRLTYEGQAPDAPWRAEARDRIDRYRKAELSVAVLDADGRAVPDARVHLQQTRHAFVFGTAMNLAFASSGDPRVPRYLEALTQRFNGVVFENELKWHGPELRNPAAVEMGLSFIEDHDLYFRAHTLVWPGSRHMPDYINARVARLRADPSDDAAKQELNRLVDQRIEQIAGRYAGRVDDWDVVNEPFTNHDLMDVLDPAGTPHGAGVMAHWFELARRSDPQAQLYLNDYGILTAGNLWTPHQQHFYDTARQLLDAGAPLQGLGMQGHFGSPLTSPSRVWEILDRYAELGLPIKVTEYDINSDQPELMADFTRDFYTAAFAHPSVESIFAWGFWSRAHWRPQAAFLNEDFSPRPHDEALRKLLFEEWWTDQTLDTDAAGQAQARVFKGEYRVTATGPDGKEKTVQLRIDDTTGDVKITLE